MPTHRSLFIPAFGKLYRGDTWTRRRSWRLYLQVVRGIGWQLGKAKSGQSMSQSGKALGWAPAAEMQRGPSRWRICSAGSPTGVVLCFYFRRTRSALLMLESAMPQSPEQGFCIACLTSSRPCATQPWGSTWPHSLLFTLPPMCAAVQAAAQNLSFAATNPFMPKRTSSTALLTRTACHSFSGQFANFRAS